MGKCMTKRIPYHICQTFCYKIAAVIKDACAIAVLFKYVCHSCDKSLPVSESEALHVSH